MTEKIILQRPIILFENDDYIAVDKPAGMVSIPDRAGKEPSVKSFLEERYPSSIFTVHRLDRETSGMIVFAKTRKAHKHLSKLFETRNIEKLYYGIVQGTPPEKKGTIEAPIKEHPSKPGAMMVHSRGKASTTDYEVVEELGPYSLVQFRIHTGRTHQIRVHMQHIGHSIVCDDLYGNSQPVYVSSLKRNFKLAKTQEEERPIMQRLALHSWILHFTDQDGEQYFLEAPLPKDMKALLQQLRKWQS